MNNKAILITGSNGFIGSNLVFYLKDKYIIFSPKRNELNLFDEEQVRYYFRNNNIDFIVHCASVGGAKGVVDANNTLDVNLKMFHNILNYKNTNTNVIVFGSGAMYDKARKLHKVKESEIGVHIPSDLYGKSKMLIAQEIKDRQDVLCLNIFACYGYGERNTRFPSYAINQVLSGKDIEINQDVIFDYLFVEDMQKIVEYFIEHKADTNIINMTPTKSSSLSEISNIVKSFSHNKTEIIIKNSEMNNEYTGDNSVLLRNYPAIEFVPIETGLKKLYEYNKRIQKGNKENLIINRWTNNHLE